jgi:phage FluMu protein Com
MPQMNRRFKDGDVGPGIRCKGCGMGIAIAQDLATVPETFRATCPKCKHVDEYQKSEVRNYVAHKKQ